MVTCDVDAEGFLRRFVLVRTEDVTGISGIGIVAEGVRLSRGKVVLCWLSNGVSSIVIHENLDDLLSIHGHGGRTKIVWLDRD